jgi:hypothetical protein
MKRPLGCLTGTGLLAALLTALVAVSGALASSNRIFSAGPLNSRAGQAIGGIASHAALEGSCAACHPAFWSSVQMRDRCLDCHTEIAAQLGDPARLHGAVAAGTDCRFCHTEHQGPDGRLTTVDEVDYAHDLAGFSLRAHVEQQMQAPLACRDCHPESLGVFAAQSCAVCHSVIDEVFSDDHTLAFGPTCLACHDGVDRFGTGWDHNGTTFPLAGAHAAASCSRCHLGMHTLAALRRTPQACVDCHSDEDIHAGRLGGSCGDCHTLDSWHDATIDHTLTGFGLEAGHDLAECSACHVNRQWAGLPRTCFGCHAQDDAHAGRFGTQCEACHRPTTWSDWTFDHDRSAFRLTGAHRSVPCLACHTAEAFGGTPSACSACHAEPAYHAGLFSPTCGSCHNTSAWRPTSYNAPHGFPMNHGGAGGNCGRCHPGTLVGYTCYGCHNQGEIANKHSERFASFSDCVSCHPTGQEADGEDD